MDALKDVDKAIELNPNYPTAYVRRALIYEEFKMFDDAKADLSKAKELDPNNSKIEGYITSFLMQYTLGQLLQNSSLLFLNLFLSDLFFLTSSTVIILFLLYNFIEFARLRIILSLSDKSFFFFFGKLK